MQLCEGWASRPVKSLTWDGTTVVQTDMNTWLVLCHAVHSSQPGWILVDALCSDGAYIVVCRNS